jgi:hypothetical protein
VRSHYVDPARRRGDRQIRVVAGDVSRELHLVNLMPSVCSVLRSKKLLDENGLELESLAGPPSGLGATLTATYRLGKEAAPSTSEAMARFLKLRGIMKDAYREVGGGEAFLRAERQNFYGDERDAEYRADLPATLAREKAPGYWSAIQQKLRVGQTIRTWSREKGDLDTLVTIEGVHPDRIEISSEGIKDPPRKITSGDFAKVAEHWHEFLAGSIPRHQLRSLSVNSAYIIALLHWIEGSAA